MPRSTCRPISRSLAWAQSRVEDGGNEVQLWTGGGYSVPGGTSNTGIWNAGLRYGWILTRPHGPGFLKGRFEYALDDIYRTLQEELGLKLVSIKAPLEGIVIDHAVKPSEN